MLGTVKVKCCEMLRDSAMCNLTASKKAGVGKRGCEGGKDANAKESEGSPHQRERGELGKGGIGRVEDMRM